SLDLSVEGRSEDIHARIEGPEPMQREIAGLLEYGHLVGLDQGPVGGARFLQSGNDARVALQLFVETCKPAPSAAIRLAEQLGPRDRGSERLGVVRELRVTKLTCRGGESVNDRLVDRCVHDVFSLLGVRKSFVFTRNSVDRIERIRSAHR